MEPQQPKVRFDNSHLVNRQKADREYQHSPLAAETSNLTSSVTSSSNESKAESRHEMPVNNGQSVASVSTRLTRDANAQYKAQEKAYMQIMRQDSINENELVPVKFGLDVDTDDTSPISENSTDGRVSPTQLPRESSFDFPDSSLDLPENRERVEWQTMLRNVLKGEVFSSEKKRISGAAMVSNPEHGKAELWVEIKAKVYNRSAEMQRRLLEKVRGEVDSILAEVKHFQVQKTGVNATRQVKDILRKVDFVELLWPSRSAIIAKKPIYESAEFQRNLEALTAWSAITESVRSQIGALQRWVGNEALDLHHVGEKASDDPMEEHSFIERLLKNNGLSRIFENRTLMGISFLIERAKATMIAYAVSFSKMSLPSYLADLLILINFPIRLVEGALILRLTYAKKLLDPSRVITYQMRDDFNLLINFAVRIKSECIRLLKPQVGWNLPSVIGESFDTTLLDALRFYFRLLNLQMSDENRVVSKESDILEQEWEFLTYVAGFVEGGDMEVAQQFSILTNRLLSRLMIQFESQLSGPPTMLGVELVKWYSALIADVRQRHRKLLRFSK